MPVKFLQDKAKQVQNTKKKNILQPTSDVLSVTPSEKADRLWSLEQEIAPIRPLLKEYDVIRKSLLGDCSGCEAKLPVEIEGEIGRVSFSPCGETKEVADMKGLLAALKHKIGYEALLSLVKINVGDVEKYLTVSEMEKFYKSVDGSRRLLKVEAKTGN